MTGNTLTAAIERFDAAIEKLRKASEAPVSSAPLADEERAEVVEQIDNAILALRDALGEGERDAAG